MTKDNLIEPITKRPGFEMNYQLILKHLSQQFYPYTVIIESDNYNINKETHDYIIVSGGVEDVVFSVSLSLFTYNQLSKIELKEHIKQMKRHISYEIEKHIVKKFLTSPESGNCIILSIIARIGRPKIIMHPEDSIKLFQNQNNLELLELTLYDSIKKNKNKSCLKKLLKR